MSPTKSRRSPSRKPFDYYFPEPVFDIEYNTDTNRIIVSRDMLMKQSEQRRLACLELEIKDKKIIVKSVLGCSMNAEYMGRGKDLLQRAIMFAQNQDMDLIIEFDVSMISIHQYSFSLRHLKLLSSGMTWYNSLGFFENTHDEIHSFSKIHFTTTTGIQWTNR